MSCGMHCLHDALPIYGVGKTSLLLTLAGLLRPAHGVVEGGRPGMVFQNAEHQFVAHTVREEIAHGLPAPAQERVLQALAHRKSTRLNSSHVAISYAVI